MGRLVAEASCAVGTVLAGPVLDHSLLIGRLLAVVALHPASGQRLLPFSLLSSLFGFL